MAPIFPLTGSTAVGSKLLKTLKRSVGEPSFSQRRPRFSVSLRFTLKSSWRNSAWYFNVVVLAALMNAASVISRVMIDLRVVIAGAGAAGIACAKILLAAGIRDLIVVDSKGVLSVGRDGLHPVKQEMAERSNPRGVVGGLADALAGADVFIGVSGGSVDPALVSTMGDQPIVFALANPTPEIDPGAAIALGAAVVATGRSDFANQINNVLAFPGIFLGALDCGAKRITEGMKVAASGAICAAVPGRAVADRIVPDPFTPGLARMVADAVIAAARAEGVAP